MKYHIGLFTTNTRYSISNHSLSLSISLFLSLSLSLCVCGVCVGMHMLGNDCKYKIINIFMAVNKNISQKLEGCNVLTSIIYYVTHSTSEYKQEHQY